MNLTKTEKAYIAGIIDGEGSIGIYKHRRPKSTKGYTYENSLIVVNTNTILMNYLKEKLGGSIRERKKPKLNWKLSYSWQVYCNSCYSILKQILPYLQIKKKRTELSIEFYEILSSLKQDHRWTLKKSGVKRSIGKTYTDRMHQIYDELREINRCGGKVRN